MLSEFRIHIFIERVFYSMYFLTEANMFWIIFVGTVPAFIRADVFVCPEPCQ